ncbi:MAG: hypothetical protein H8F28_28060 [Fibrella sp.]|nr:hypothetical protein [Armatimonadota bacterium]
MVVWTLLTSLAVVLAMSPSPAIAQRGAPTPDEAGTRPRPIPANTQPDVQIVVLPLPNEVYAVSSVYPKQVPKAVAQGRIDALLALTKWKATNRKFSDAPAVPNPLSDDQTPKGNLSAASFETSGAIYAEDGTINWEPFLRAFGDVRRINMVFFTGTDFAYTGPVSFDNERITFSASSGQGTVAAVANIKKPEPSPASFGLPQYQTGAATPKTVVATKPDSQGGQTRRVVGIVGIALFATAVALIIYAMTSRLVTKP